MWLGKGSGAPHICIIWSEFCPLSLIPKNMHHGIAVSQGFQVALMVKNPLANAEDTGDLGSIPGSRRSPGGGHGNSVQYSCLENPMDRGAWQATFHDHRVRHDWTNWSCTRMCPVEICLPKHLFSCFLIFKDFGKHFGENQRKYIEDKFNFSCLLFVY